MTSNSLKPWIRLVLVLCGASLVYVLFVPMWRIDLDAPQYPEGLCLQIYPDHIGGNVDIINGLNHYIGMKTLHTEDFVEFRVLPILISFFALAFVLTALLNRRKILYILLALFVTFGIVAMADFWRWEYNYGHNLDPNAAIIVPGMAYQPPLIGFKQLLNFGAYSIPDTGGWIFLGTGAILLFCVVITARSVNTTKTDGKKLAGLFIPFFMLLLTSCNYGPDPIRYGKDNCHFCKMTISDRHYGAEIVTGKGKVFKFDELKCLQNFIATPDFKKTGEYTTFITDFAGSHELVTAETAFYLKSEQLHGPMGGKVAGFSSKDSLDAYFKNLGGERITWSSLIP